MASMDEGARARQAAGFAGTSLHETVYTAFAALFAVVLVLTNIVGVKLFVLFPDGRPGWWPGSGPLTLTTGIITYPVTFFLTDVVSEIWGRRRADFMVLLGFLASLLMLAVVQVARMLPYSEHWTTPVVPEAEEMQVAFEATFYFPGLLLFASMLAYLVAQLFDVRLYHFWRRVTRGRHMWLRNNGSTVFSQLVDTIIVNGIYLGFGLGMGWPDVWGVIGAVYVCKLAIALTDTPLLYVARAVLRRVLGLRHDAAPASAPLG